jgi:hypothetical protein
LARITTLHELVAEHLDPAAEPDQVLIGIETCSRCCGSITRPPWPRSAPTLPAAKRWAVLTVAPSPDLGRRLTQSRIETLLRRAGRQRNISTTAATIPAALTSEQLTARPGVIPAYTAAHQPC